MTIREMIRTLEALPEETQVCDLVDFEELWPMLGLIVRDPGESELSRTRILKLQIVADPTEPDSQAPVPSPEVPTPPPG